jgi:signal transduction histidine kinase
MAATAPRVRRSLSDRLLWLTIATVLVIETVVFIPAITSARGAWLAQRLSEAQIAALSAAAAPDGAVDHTIREALLRLSGTEMIRLATPGQDLLVLPQDRPQAPAQTIDLVTESWPRAALRTFGSLFEAGDPLVQVSGPGPMHPGTTLTVMLRGGHLAHDLRDFAGAFGLFSLVIAGIAGLLVYAAMLVFLVRPMRSITHSISAFRADPECAAAPAPNATTPLDDDEIAVAAQELAAMQLELRTALWRNARLAAIGTAMAKVSHDLRGILSPALLAAERLQSSQDPAVRRGGDILVLSVERATGLLRETMEFAREGPATPKRVRCSLHGVILEAAEQVRATMTAFHVEISAPEDLEVEVDRTQLLRVFANLLRNAAEAHASIAKVDVCVEPAEIGIVVADDASGLPAPVIEKLFQPFVPGGRHGSTGLGLAIVRDLIRAHGGEIVLVETGESGTIFGIKLPASLARKPARRGAAVAAGAAQSTVSSAAR